MPAEQLRAHRLQRTDGGLVTGDLGDVLQRDGVVERARRIRSPDEGAVRSDEDGRDVERIGAVGKPLDDHATGGGLVIAGDLGRLHGSRHRDRATEMIRVGRTERRDRPTRLSPAGRVRRVRVDDSAGTGEGSIELEMRRRVR